jgi:hypothetical protein
MRATLPAALVLLLATTSVPQAAPERSFYAGDLNHLRSLNDKLRSCVGQAC